MNKFDFFFGVACGIYLMWGVDVLHHYIDYLQEKLKVEKLKE